MNRRPNRSRFRDRLLVVSLAVAGSSGAALTLNPAGMAGLHRAAAVCTCESDEVAQTGIDLVAETVDDPAAIVLVAGTEGAGTPPAALPPSAGIIGVQASAPEADQPAPRRTSAPPVMRDDSVSSVSYRAAAPSSALEPVTTQTTSPAMAAIVQQAESHLQRGFELANRGAHFSARAEFLMAVRLVAQGLDAEQGVARHGVSLAAGMRALDEADDLVPRGTSLDGEIDVYATTRPHHTPVLQDIKPGEVTAQAALQRYYAYAEEQLAAAVSPERFASSALYAIGKLHALWTAQNAPIMVNSEAKAVVFYQAAMLVDPDNAIAANDLAVLLARVGRYAQARELLIRAAQQSPRAAVWHNLAVVHARLGETELAELARRNEVVSGGGIDPANAQAVAAMQSVKWVDPQTFASSARPATDLPAPSARPANPPPAATPAESQPATARISRWFSWGSSQR